MLKVLFIAAGGAIGSVLRYYVAGWSQHWAGGSFPLGTMIANVTGCLLIGFLATVLTGPVLIREEYRMGLLVGILGGYTTFSTFSWETNRLAEDSEWLLAGINIVVSLVACLVATWIGSRLALYLYGP